MITESTYKPKVFEAEVFAATQKYSRIEIIIYIILAFFCMLGVLAYFYQLKDGLIVTGLRDYVSWGLYISMLFFFVGISLIGAFISSVLRFAGEEWRHPVSRIGEAITISSVLFAGLMPVVDMGRPERLGYLFIDGRIQSPILWDIVAIITYLVGSILFFYLPLIPDLAKLKNSVSGFRGKVYRILSLGWTGSPIQKQKLEQCNKLMAIVILPVAISVHTISAWLIAMTHRPGWNSTIMGPYFVFGALMAGCAVMILIMALLRKLYRFEHILTAKHFSHIATLMLALCAFYLYLNINKYGVPAFIMERNEKMLLDDLLKGRFSVMFWSVIIFGLIIPIVLLAFKKIRNSIRGTVMISVLVLLGALLNRYLIVVPNLLHPLIHMQNAKPFVVTYFPSNVELAITAASLAGFVLVVLVLTKFFPAIPIEETEEAVEKFGMEETGMEETGATGAAKIIATIALLLLFIYPLSAQEKLNGTINLKIEKGDSVNTITATVVDAQTKVPLKNVELNFSIKRMFGYLSIGDVITNEKGEAITTYESNLPGNSETGNVITVAKVEDSDVMNDTSAQITAKSKIVFAEIKNNAGGIIESKPPLWLSITFYGVVLTVWSAFAFVIFQIVQLKKNN
jgi:molybdopterin-containing oxidoreductase family membrane subunit